VTAPDNSPQRILILAPYGRDADIACALFAEAGMQAHACADVEGLCHELENGAACAVVVVEALAASDVSGLSAWIAGQPPWSDMPIVLLTARENVPDWMAESVRYQGFLGNVTFLERPFHPTTLVSVARSAIRSRWRQYQARESIERYLLLARELQHRTKNLLAIIQSLGTASFPPGKAREDFFARLHALAKAQDLILEGDDRGTSMRSLVGKALEHFGHRISFDGPDVSLRAGIAQGFALVLHELATNATKHGALRQPTGKIAVRWSEMPGPPPLLHFHWSERGGAPVSPPTQRGFGMKLLELAVAGDAPPHFDYSPQGFDYQLTATL
jgi:two-component sensor histidine kinase